jgi:hypothetical protein
MQVVWGSPEGANSRAVWQKVNPMLGDESISRASVIDFLEDMREMDVLFGVETTGKGGHHYVYSPRLDEGGFRAYIVENIIMSLMENYPDATREAIKRLNG